MYIEQVCIEGFKSYAQRVTLDSFDPKFNAIAGLNGSGKSNCLDSICFVMGITNLQHVRATNLQDLIYKQGQAGISKATVSITFRNDDPNNSPAGYEDKQTITVTRQIVLGGRNKYLINGHVAQTNRVQDLFHSVQLNVNNPHFLIMQGRINQVCNMKPPEILSLLEEACGTRMFEKKKEASLKTLEKKGQRLNEIDELLNSEVRPSLEKLRKASQDSAEYEKCLTKVEHLKKYCTAYDFFVAVQRQDAFNTFEEESKGQLAALEQQVADLQEDLVLKEQMVKALTAEKQIQAEGEVKELQEEVNQLAVKVAKESTKLENQKKTVAKERAALQQVEASIKELDEEALEAALAKAKEAREAAAKALEAAEKEVEAAARELAGAEAGDGRDDSNRSLAERLADAKNAQVAADAEAKTAALREKHLKKQLAEQRKQLAAKEREGGALQTELQEHHAAVEQGQRQLQALGFDEERAGQLEAEVEAGQAAVRKAKQEVDAMSAQLSGLMFDFQDPSPGFDRSKVKGRMARLVRVQEPSAALALEVVAGGKLYNVVVDNERTGQDLLERGRLRQRVTIVPLNKIKPQEIPPHVVAAAKRLVGDRAVPAIELVGSSDEVSAAIKFAFGGAFVCKDAGAAQKLAFSREVRTRCVTLEGDDFNPTGLLTGGSRANTAPLLQRLGELAEAEERLAGHQRRLQDAQGQLQALAAASAKHRKLKQELEVKQHRLGLLQERIAGSEAAVLAAAVAAAEEELAAAEEAATTAAAKKAEMVELAKTLADEIANFARNRGARIKAAQARQKAAAKQLEAARKDDQAKDQALQAAIAEKEAAEGERRQLEEQVAPQQAAITELEQQVAALQAVVDEARAQHEAVVARLAAKKERLRECDAEIQAASKERQQLADRMEGVQRDQAALRARVDAERDSTKSSLEHAKMLEKDHPWISLEKELFGQEVGEYNFAQGRPREAAKELKSHEKELDKIKARGIVPHAAPKYEACQAECAVLEHKRAVVEKDRQKISEVITELEEKKRVALEATWLKVNRDLGNIFSTLLPGTSAKLEPLEGTTFLDGLELKVAFGGVWKESLTELSGGQRALLALSLILALCRYKPAPLYILDEVDAALDMNNSQNIGRMIKEHFPDSQFIIVSHKEGMFSNANVLYHTKVVNGVSTITRTQNRATGAAARTENRGTSKAGSAAAPSSKRPRQVLRDAN